MNDTNIEYYNQNAEMQDKGKVRVMVLKRNDKTHKIRKPDYDFILEQSIEFSKVETYKIKDKENEVTYTEPSVTS